VRWLVMWGAVILKLTQSGRRGMLASHRVVGTSRRDFRRCWRSAGSWPCRSR
jgi:hypothetical protein